MSTRTLQAICEIHEHSELRAENDRLKRELEESRQCDQMQRRIVLVQTDKVVELRSALRVIAEHCGFEENPRIKAIDAPVFYYQGTLKWIAKLANDALEK